MNCELSRNNIEELLDRILPAGQEAEVLHHLEQCADCRQLLRQEQAFRRQLSQLPYPAMRPGFPAEALAKARQNQRRIPRQGFAAGFATAMAASVALWFAVVPFAPQTGGAQLLHTVSLSVGQVQHVNLVFNSPEQLDQATFTLLMPENAELDGYPGRRQLVWTTSLHKGQNRLSLPVRVNSVAQGEIIARISHGDGERVFRLRLDATERSDTTNLKQV